MQNIISGEICKKCGECCKNFPYIELSQDDIDAIGKLTGLPFEVFTNQKGDGVAEYFLQFKENGECIFLKENNNEYYCAVYVARSEICRNYPSKPRQHEVCRANREMMLRKYSS